jgi:cellulose synthase/poly-beta-1,6-N-acetylglucosamine synthase-like glycosyltransferase
MTLLHVLIPLLGIAFVAFHAAFARWLLAGIPVKPVRSQVSYETPMVTILVAARDEASNLKNLIPALLAQSYPVDRTQIVIVDDRSSDPTSQVVRELGQDRVELVRVDVLPAGLGPKKHALQQGLAIARGEIVVQIDADNLPDPDWLSCMISCFHQRTGAVCGLVLHGPAAPHVKNWFHGIWAVEALGWSAVQAAAIGAGKPISANGGNLAYRRKAFDDVGGFGRHQNVISGDDDFLIQSLSDSGRWEVICPEDVRAQLLTAGPESWRHVWEQRKRWGSKCIRYDLERVLLLGGVYLSYAYVAVVGMFGLWAGWALAWSILVASAIVLEAWLLVFRMSIRTRAKKVLRWFPLAALVQIPLVLAAVVAGTLGKFRWKDGLTRAVRN